jgi:lipoprotein NlpD
MQLKSGLTVLISALTLLGCASREVPAPIVNITHAPQYANVSRPRSIVTNDNEDGGTKLGSLDNNNSKSDKQQVANPNKTNSNANVAAPVAPVASSDWVMPLNNGTVNRGFSQRSKGIDYTGKYGQDVYAINNGKVVYSGNGLKGYGNLVIIKHDKTYLSAYANNKENLVKDGENVTRGQKIATMGKDSAGKPLLHFEVRQNGKPIDPTILVK